MKALWRTYTKDEILEFCSQAQTLSDIAIMMGYDKEHPSCSSVRKALAFHQINFQTSAVSYLDKKPLSIEELKEQLGERGLGNLIGAMLGDGGHKDNLLLFGHSYKQIEWVFHKKIFFENLFESYYPIHVYKNEEYDTWQVRFNVTSNFYTYSIVNAIYNADNQKMFSNELLECLTPEGIAWWYMDDGSMSFKRRNERIHSIIVTLNTYETLEKNQRIVDYFKNKWNIQWNITKGHKDGIYRLSMGLKEGRKFFELIKPYIIPSMMYKIDLSPIEKQEPIDNLTRYPFSQPVYTPELDKEFFSVREAARYLIQYNLAPSQKINSVASCIRRVLDSEQTYCEMHFKKANGAPRATQTPN